MLTFRQSLAVRLMQKSIAKIRFYVTMHYVSFNKFVVYKSLTYVLIRSSSMFVCRNV